jgi:hypothetical protein
VSLKTIALLTVSSLLNAAIGAGAFFFGNFATAPDMQDVTMRVGFYVVNGIALAAVAGVIAPWVFARQARGTAAFGVAALPALLVVLAVLSFLTLDSWLNRTFGG